MALVQFYLPTLAQSGGGAHRTSGDFGSFCFREQLQSCCLFLCHLVIHLRITFPWVLEEKQACVPQKKSNEAYQYEPDDVSFTVVLVARERMGILAILGVPMSSGKYQRPGGVGSDNREGKPECPTQSTSQPCLLLHQKLWETVIPKGPTWRRTGPWVGSSKPEGTSALPNYGTSTIMTRYLRRKGASFPSLTPLSCLVERDQGYIAP